MKSPKRVFALALVSIATAVAFAEETAIPPGGQDNSEANDPLLTVERIYGRNEFAAETFSAKWLPDGSGYTTLEDSVHADGFRDIVRVDAATGKKTILVDAGLLKPGTESSPITIDSYQLSDDLSQVLIYTNSQRVWRQKTRGDYWVFDRGSRTIRQLGNGAQPSTLMFAKFSPDAKYVSYLIDADIFIEDLRDGTQTRLTHRTDNQINGTFDWVYEEELSLRDGVKWSPDSKAIAYWQLDTTDVPIFTMINNTDSLYPKLIQFAHPKVGQKNSSCRAGIIRLGQAKTTWIKTPGDPRDNYIARMEWSPEGKLVIQQLNRLQNAVNLMFANLDGTCHPLFHDEDEAWVDVTDSMRWLTDNRHFTWSSERDGWRHLYLASSDTGKARLITPGEFDAIELLHVDQTQGCVYFVASPDTATERYLFRANLNASADPTIDAVSRTTPTDAIAGTHAYDIAPNGRWAIHTWSNASTPPVVELINLPEHKTVRVIADNSKLNESLAEIDLQPIEFFRVPIGDGVELDAWSIAPTGLDEAREASHPLLLYVYGEPAGSTVTNRWGGNSLLWHQMMAQRGYCVMSIDNRGTKVPRGRAWRKSIYRQVGILAPNDQAAAVRSILASRTYLDPDRVGVWGWSGGGSMTLAAMFKHPELYKTGISIAPVPNQRYYDTIYQERYMGMPDDNVDGYTNGSVINFAHQLQGNLLLVHGTGDDNCHYQTMEMLINELVRHEKQFQMMAYPNRSHSIREGDGTTPHLRKMMADFLEQNL